LLREPVRQPFNKEGLALSQVMLGRARGLAGRAGHGNGGGRVDGGRRGRRPSQAKT
jgi:hypothetical protein